jgi:hemolysin activation/secretion protein
LIGQSSLGGKVYRLIQGGRRIHRHLAALACIGAAMVLSCPAIAQLPPDAGRVIEQLRPPAPQPEIQAPDLRIEPPADEKSKVDTPPFPVASFRVTGATVFPEPQLLDLLGPTGVSLTLFQVQERAARLTKFYNDQGYSVARALVPAQNVREGVVEIRVLEGHYGHIDIRNATDVSEARIRALLGGVKEGALIHGPSLEKGILLVSDLAGIQPKATLEPGESTGLSDLVLEIGAGKATDFAVTYDNAGNRFTGKDRLSFGFAWNSPANIGDRLSASLITSGNLLQSGRVGYDLPIGSSGLRGGPYVSHTYYLLGENFGPLDAHGTADSYGALFSYPLVRSSAMNLRAVAAGEARRLEDRVGSTGSINNKSADLVQLGIGGDARDGLLAGAITAFQGQVTAGKLKLETPLFAAADALTTQTQGNYSKFVANVTRIQGLSESWRLGFTYTGQWAAKNLDSSEKFSIGGVSGVRAYPPGEAAGDDAQLLQTELRYAGGPLGPGQFQPFAFFDAARSRIVHNGFAAATLASKNVRELAGYGVGAEWSLPGSLFVRAWQAFKATSEPATSDTDKGSRFWLQAGVVF